MKRFFSVFCFLFNILGRAFGVGLVVVGIILEISYAISLFDKTSEFNNNYDLVQKTFLFFFPLIFIVLGWFIIKAKGISL